MCSYGRHASTCGLLGTEINVVLTHTLENINKYIHKYKYEKDETVRIHFILYKNKLCV